MPFYYTLREKAAEAGYVVYMGKDKFENEDLLKYGWPEDLWFHVDKLSSAHVYLRCPPRNKEGAPLNWKVDIPKRVIQDCCQIVKHNSIEGSKLAKCDIVITPFPNLHKDDQKMVTGQVGFHVEKDRITLSCEKDKETIKMLEKTKTWQDVDLRTEREQRDQEETVARKKAYKDQVAAEKALKKQRDEEAAARDYSLLENEDAMTSNKDFEATEDASAAVDYEDDFM